MDFTKHLFISAINTVNIFRNEDMLDDEELYNEPDELSQNDVNEYVKNCPENITEIIKKLDNRDCASNHDD